MALKALKYPPESGLWKSMVVKAVRIGWPDGLEAAARFLSKSEMSRLILVQYFEDILPHPDELLELERATAEQDWEKLCSYETLHGKGLAPEWHQISQEKSIPLAEDYPETVQAAAKRHGWWISKRGYPVFWTWLVMKDRLPFGKRREPDRTPYEGVPSSIADLHCKEGRMLGNRETILSGTWEQHLRIGEIVMKHGWEEMRRRVHDEPIIWRDVLPPKQANLW